MTKTILAVVSDTHIGGMTALMPPTWVTDEKQQITASPGQQWIYSNWLDYWEYVTLLAGVKDGGRRTKHKLVVVHLGDIIDGNHHHTVQSLPNVIDQENMASFLMTTVANLCRGNLYIIRGTEAHAGEAAQSEVRISQNVGAKSCEWEKMLDVGGVLFDLAHHGRAGSRDWTSAAAGQAAEVAFNYMKNEMRPPDVVLRGHSHIVDDSGEKLECTRSITCPAWQLKTGHGYKVASNKKRSDIGGMVFHIENERYTADFSHARYKAPPGQKVITIA